METQSARQHTTIHRSDTQLFVLREDPLNAEPPGDLLRESFLTPQQLFYVRTHGSIPAVDPTSYRLRLTGLVERPRELLLDELRAMAPARTVTATLECAGNRRAELMAIRPIPGELAWGGNVIGTANWRGVPLAEVLRAVGVQAAARHVAFTSLDEARFEGETLHFGGSIALEKALSPDVLLAYEMNDEPLTPEHGFPLRVIVPGYIGARSVKWLGEIQLQERPSTNPYEARDYKLFPPEMTRQTALWSRAQPLEELGLNAVISTPQDGETLAAGPMRIQGYAISCRRVARGAGRTLCRRSEDLDDGHHRRARRSVCLVLLGGDRRPCPRRPPTDRARVGRVEADPAGGREPPLELRRLHEQRLASREHPCHLTRGCMPVMAAPGRLPRLLRCTPSRHAQVRRARCAQLAGGK